MMTELTALSKIFPEISILVMGCIVLISGLYAHGKTEACVYWLAQFALVSAFCMTLALLFHLDPSEIRTPILYDMIVIDKLGYVLKLAIYTVVFAVFVYGRDYVRERGISPGEYYALSLFSLLGMALLVSSNNLLTLFLALELLSLPIYALVAMFKDSSIASTASSTAHSIACKKSTEAAIKYFVMGALATGILLYGFSILYGVTGSLDFRDIAHVLGNMQAEKNKLAVFGFVFVLVGLAFKLGIAPFHMWVPDVYEGAPATVTLFIATAPKLAVLGILLRLLMEVVPSLSIHLQELLILLSIVSIATGNLIAIVQTNIRRLLAYSSIAHMGYMILGAVAITDMGYAASLFYIITYVITSLALFGFVLMMGTSQELQEVSSLSGLNQRDPWLAFMMLIVLFSMAGIPPIVGFMAKFGVLKALISADFVGLAIFAMLFAVLGVYYSIRIIKVMYFEAPKETLMPVVYSRTCGALLTINCFVVLILGLFPSALFDLCQSIVLY